jgi:hypothetical protein
MPRAVQVQASLGLLYPQFSSGRARLTYDNAGQSSDQDRRYWIRNIRLAAAYFLSRKHEVFLFEREPRLGGHTNTITVDSSRGPLAVDTGFIVHNDRTYSNLIKLLTELGVPRATSDMSFAVSCR